jgi:hypothetical protein
VPLLDRAARRSRARRPLPHLTREVCEAISLTEARLHGDIVVEAIHAMARITSRLRGNEHELSLPKFSRLRLSFSHDTSPFFSHHVQTHGEYVYSLVRVEFLLFTRLGCNDRLHEAHGVNFDHGMDQRAQYGTRRVNLTDLRKMIDQLQSV